MEHSKFNADVDQKMGKSGDYRMSRLFSGFNRPDDLDRISGDSFRFHGPMKALFYKVLRLINPPPKAWLDDIDGNMGVLRDIYNEYLIHERQAWRKDVLTRVIPFSLCLANYDENYEEVFNWFIYRICQEYEKGRFQWIDYEKRPECWFQDGRGRIGLTKENRILVKEIMQNDSEKAD